jgi:hypothetical protein
LKKDNTYKEIQKSKKEVHPKYFRSVGKSVRELGFLFILLTCFVSFSQNEMVKVTIDTTNIRIGEQFNLKIWIGETKNVILPKLQLKGLEVVDSTKIDTLKNSLIRKYILTGFDSGSFYIPRQQIFVRNQAFLTDSLLVNVATIAIDTTKIKKFAIKSIESEPYIFEDFKMYIYILLAALAIIVFWINWFVIKKRKETEDAPTYRTLPPFEEAILRLNELDEKLLWQNNKIKEYYSELTEIVRGYIERELKVPALENTTDEVLAMIKDFKTADSIETSKETIKKLKDLLREADLVKFAKSKPLAIEIEDDRRDAEFIIGHLKPKQIIEKEDELE